MNKMQLSDERISCNAINFINGLALVLLKANRLRKILCQDLSSQYESVILGPLPAVGESFYR
ncbi:hypothetical protein GIX45_03945 [Erwinia sp. CPCC 100877]|nr:hypothetical protein [Erwinia sp. CPCC 100877]